jgi:hypothetical protein
MGYALMILLSVAVGVVVYRFSANVPVREHDPAMWVGGAAGPAEQVPPRPPTNFERLSISREGRSWHDRAIGVFGLVIAVAVGAAALAFALYLLGRAALALLEQAVGGSV